MEPTVEEVTTRTEMLEIEPVNPAENPTVEQAAAVKVHTPMTANKSEPNTSNADSEPKIKTISKENPITADETESKIDVMAAKDDQMMKKEENVVDVQIEPKTGVSFPVKLDDGKLLNAVGVRKKTILGLGIKIYGFGVYADNEKLKELLRSKININGSVTPAKPTEEMYKIVIDSDVEMTVRLVLVFGGLTMSMVRKNFDEVLGVSIKKLNGGRKDDELTNKVMGEASNKIKLTAGSVIEITRLPGYILQTKVKDELVSKVASELLCRAFLHMYLGDDVFDQDAKERFGMSLLSLF
ncbi:Chalcone isomerase [Macleaya cordata]|uniref:Chalcone isomerase n=1 Tax=Macleaya cordata TaxID=56857 RepID=A0A200RD09_MACCD|nr:Chalcone isomerase [Macleaya cordata]